MLTMCKANVIITCLPQFHSAPGRSSSFSQHSDRSEPRSSCWGGGGPCGGPAASLQFTVYWSRMSTVCFATRGVALRVPGMQPRLQWNRVLLLANVLLQYAFYSALILLTSSILSADMLFMFSSPIDWYTS
jgi:hypothetical protein